MSATRYPLQWPIGWKRSSKPLSLYVERFLDSFTCLPSGCWQWTNTDLNKYGSLWFGNQSIRAHRFSYLLFNGDADREMDVDHLCRNRGCVNPAHLELVSRSVNIRRGRLGTRWNQDYCPHGHPLKPENIRTKIDRRRGQPKVECRLCHNERERIRSAYKRLLHKVHPDKGGSDYAFQEVQEAFRQAKEAVR